MNSVMRYARRRLVLAALVVAAAGSVKFWYGHTESRLLTSVGQVRRLSVDAAREGHSVCIRGTIVYRGLDYFILADGTGALRFEAPGAVVLLRSGWDLSVQALEVTPGKKVVWAFRAWGPPVDLGPSTTIQLLHEPGAPEAVHFGDLR
jgi:hypothetical protein